MAVWQLRNILNGHSNHFPATERNTGSVAKKADYLLYDAAPR